MDIQLYNDTIVCRTARVLRSLETFIHVLDAYSQGYIPYIYAIPFRECANLVKAQGSKHIFSKGSLN